MSLAFDEAIARAFSEHGQTQPTLRFWVNRPSVIVGRFQEVHAEVDLDQCIANGVRVVRRFTGGGTVFHDESTLNMTIVSDPNEVSTSFNFQQQSLNLISKALSRLGINSVVESPNAIMVQGRKICGSAAAIGKSFALFHSSILVDTNLRLLELTLTPSISRTNSRFVLSRRRPVTTISESASRPISIVEVAQEVKKVIEDEFGGLQTSLPLQNELDLTEQLYERKYSSNEWNMEGRVPSCPRDLFQSYDYSGMGPLDTFS